MITQTVTVGKNNSQNIIIGRRGTFETEQIVFDATYLSLMYGTGTAMLLVRRPSDTSAYPAVISQDGDIITWTISNVDTSFKGHGECELFWYVDGGLAKSVIWDVTILRDIGTADGTPPDPYETWLDTLTDLSGETLVNAQAAEAAAETATEAVETLNAVQSTLNIPYIATKRVEGGTQVLNQPFMLFAAMQVGFYLDTTEYKLHVFNLIANAKVASKAATVKHYYLTEKNSANDPYEFTLENCPGVSEISNSANKVVFKSRANVSNMTDGAVWDMRLCSVGYDSDGDEMYRIYSEQYRYTIANGKATRTVVPTEPQSAKYFIDFGVFKVGNTDSVYRNLCYLDTNVSILPIVSTDQPLQFEFIIPDEWFENAPLGYAVCAKGGDGVCYCTGSFDKAEVTT